MTRVAKGQPVSEHLTLSDLKMGSSTAFKTFKNYNIIITPQHSSISVELLSVLLIFELIQQAALMDFMLF